MESLAALTLWAYLLMTRMHVFTPSHHSDIAETVKGCGMPSKIGAPCLRQFMVALEKQTRNYARAAAYRRQRFIWRGCQYVGLTSAREMAAPKLPSVRITIRRIQ